MTFLSGVGHKLKFLIYDSFVQIAVAMYDGFSCIFFDAALRGNGGNGKILWGVFNDSLENMLIPRPFLNSLWFAGACLKVMGINVKQQYLRSPPSYPHRGRNQSLLLSSDLRQ